MHRLEDNETGLDIYFDMLKEQHILVYSIYTYIAAYHQQNQDIILVGYADTRYTLNSHKAKSQIDFQFTYDGKSLSWRSTK